MSQGRRVIRICGIARRNRGLGGLGVLTVRIVPFPWDQELNLKRRDTRSERIRPESDPGSMRPENRLFRRVSKQRNGRICE